MRTAKQQFRETACLSPRCYIYYHLVVCDMNYPKFVKTDATELTSLFFWDMMLPSRGIGLRRFGTIRSAFFFKGLISPGIMKFPGLNRSLEANFNQFLCIIMGTVTDTTTKCKL